MITAIFGLGQTLVRMLPRRKWDSEIIRQFFMSQGVDFENIDRLISIVDQDTATKALAGTLDNLPESIHAQYFIRLMSGATLPIAENLYGIASDLTLTEQERRNNLIAHTKQRAQTPTPEFIKAQVEQYVQQAEIIENTDLNGNFAAHQFIVQVILPRALISDAVKAQILSSVSQSRPIIDQFAIRYTEEDWNALDTPTERDWATIGNVDWANLRF